ncbi:hypothetical protein RIF29_39638 [Crotalaria pallida]|uniref:Uncharacterized protein n=1 Tax=Crotalaria pallida TaxID=3830 RepID=A0AAN9E383_CROPI
MADLPPPRRQSSLLLMQRASQQPFQSLLPARPPWQPPMSSPLPMQPPSCLPLGPPSCLTPQPASYLLLQSPFPIAMQSPLPGVVVVQPPLLLNSVNGVLVEHMPWLNPNLNPQVLNPPSVTGCGWGNLSPFANRYEPFGQGPYFFGVRPDDSGHYHHVRSPPPQPQANVNGFVGNRSAFASPSDGTGVFLPLHHFRIANKESSKNDSKELRQNQGGVSPTTKISDQNDGLIKEEESHQSSPSSDYGLPEEWTY